MVGGPYRRTEGEGRELEIFLEGETKERVMETEERERLIQSITDAALEPLIA